MTLRNLFFLAVTVVFIGSLPTATKATSPTDINFDTGVGFNAIQEPFSNFLNSASQVSLQQNETEQSPLLSSSTDEATKYWETMNEWVKEKTGLDVWGVLKVIGGIVVFTMNITIYIMTTIVSVVEWLISLIPGTGGN